MKILSTLFFIFICSLYFGQDTLYYSSDWEETTNTQRAMYYSVTEFHLGNAGIRTNYYTSRKKHSEFRIVDGKKNGFAIWYSFEGVMLESGRYENGIENGTFRYFDNKGNVYKEALYMNGKVVTPEVSDEPMVADVEIIDFPEVDAQFVGGNIAMKKFIQRNIVYPEVALIKGDQGKVYISFTIEKTGELSNLEILRGVSPELDAEAMRVVNLMPKWIPGEKNGQPVSSKIQLPIIFNLD